MPPYYYETKTGSLSMMKGVELCDMQAVQREAARALAEMARDCAYDMQARSIN